MIWIAPSGKDQATDTLEKRLWDAAAQFTKDHGINAAATSAAAAGKTDYGSH